MKRKIAVVVALLLVVALAVAWSLWGPASAPAGQPPLVHINAANYQQFKDSFNKASGTTRVIALLSPT